MIYYQQKIGILKGKLESFVMFDFDKNMDDVLKTF